MAVISTTCPHCDAQNNTFDIAHARSWPLTSEDKTVRAPYEIFTRRISATSYCVICNRPVGFVLSKTGNSQDFMTARLSADELVKNRTGLEPFGLTVESVFPSAPAKTTPPHLPQHVVKSFEQAEQNFRLGNPDAAIAMYAKALEAGLRWRFPGIKGMLNEMIGTLLTRKLLPPEIGDWAHQVRLVRKDAVHDGDELGAVDMEAGRNFADAVLRYTITFPTDVAIRRGRPAESILPGWVAPEEAVAEGS